GSTTLRPRCRGAVEPTTGGCDLHARAPGAPWIGGRRGFSRGVSTPLPAIPADLQQHIRYPEDLFSVQAQLYRTYHMKAPEVFYNREDLWQFPRQAATINDNRDAGPAAAFGRDVPRMAPYYMIMRLPGQTRAEYVLM